MNFYEYFPELDYYFLKSHNMFGELNEYRVNTPEVENIDNTGFNGGSVFELLFEPIYDKDYYVYHFREITSASLTKKIQDRLIIKNSSVRCYIADSDYTYNALNLSEQELSLLDELLKYKNGLDPDLDQYQDVVLDTKLAYYIYHYLNTMINRDVEWLNNLDTSFDAFDDDDDTVNMLGDLYEIHVLNLIHNEVKQYTELIDSHTTHSYPVRARFTLTQHQIDDDRIIVGQPLIDTNKQITIYNNGNPLDITAFTIAIDNDQSIIDFESTELNLKENDIFIVDYYSTIDTYEHDTEVVETIEVRGEI